jgi:hypothetical protein
VEPSPNVVIHSITAFRQRDNFIVSPKGKVQARFCKQKQYLIQIHVSILMEYCKIYNMSTWITMSLNIASGVGLSPCTAGNFWPIVPMSLNKSTINYFIFLSVVINHNEFQIPLFPGTRCDTRKWETLLKSNNRQSPNYHITS